jgi:hypothetical protein
LLGPAFLAGAAFLCAAGLLACVPAAKDAAPGTTAPAAMAKRTGVREEILMFMALKS